MHFTSADGSPFPSNTPGVTRIEEALFLSARQYEIQIFLGITQGGPAKWWVPNQASYVGDSTAVWSS